jgi:hypothetical protein
MRTHYLSRDDYERLLTAIQLCPVDPLTREPDRSELMIALGEIGGVFSEEYTDEDVE